MKKILYYTISFSIFFVVSASCSFVLAEEISPSIVELIKPALPSEFSIRQKLSLKETLSTLFADLEVYVSNFERSSKSNLNTTETTPLTSQWTPQNDQFLLDVLIQNKDKIPSEVEINIITYFTLRLKKASQESQKESIDSYIGISKLFPQASFWIPYFESPLLQNKIDWSKSQQSEWYSFTFLPILSKSNSTSSLWNKNLLINSFNLLKLLHSDLISNKNLPKDTRLPQFFELLEAVNKIFELKDSRLKNLTIPDVLDLEINYFTYLQEDLHQLYESIYISQNQIINLQNTNLIPLFQSSSLETSFIYSLILSYQKGRYLNFIENKRIQNFLTFHDHMVYFINKDLTQWSDLARLRLNLNAIFYLRSAIMIKLLSGRPQSFVIPKYLTKLNSKITLKTDSSTLSLNSPQKSSETLWYDELILVHEEFLRLTQMTIYNLSLVQNCFKENLQTPTCSFWRDRFPMQQREITDELGLKRRIWEVSSKSPLYLPAGNLLIEPNDTLIITAPEIHFHFLSRITAPSGHIILKTNKLTLPWIDVSGKKGSLGVESNGFPGQKPWIKKSEYCITTEYLEGVTFSTSPRKKKVDWIGFSIKNPFPQNIFVCSSDAQNKNRDVVGNLDQILDVGLPPDFVESVPPVHGEKGGTLRIEIGLSADKFPLFNPLLVSMGGDGSQGLTGHDSPLCNNKGIYNSFKIGLSHHKEWFQNWILHPANQSLLKLVTKGEYGDHWYGLFEVNIPGTSGSNGGNGASGGEIKIHFDGIKQPNLPSQWFLSAGAPGRGGKGGTCGPGPLKDGTDGSVSTNGIIEIKNDQRTEARNSHPEIKLTN